jgi:hypothetical protein
MAIVNFSGVFEHTLAFIGSYHFNLGVLTVHAKKNLEIQRQGFIYLEWGGGCGRGSLQKETSFTRTFFLHK